MSEMKKIPQRPEIAQEDKWAIEGISTPRTKPGALIWKSSRP